MPFGSFLGQESQLLLCAFVNSRQGRYLGRFKPHVALLPSQHSGVFHVQSVRDVF